MSIIQALIGAIVSSGSGGGGGGGGTSYPLPGTNYVAQGASGFSVNGTAYDPGGAVDGIYAASTGWRRVTTAGTWSVSGNDDYPGIFVTEDQAVVDAYGGFGYTNLDASSYYAMEWKGYIKAVAGSYHNFYTTSDDVCMFWIGNAALNPTQGNAYVISNGGTTYPTNSLLLTEDKWYPIRMRFQEWSGAENCQVFYASEGGTAYGMLNYFTADRLRYNGYTNNYGSTNSLILNLGNATTNVYSGLGSWIDSSPAKNDANLLQELNPPIWLLNEQGGVFYLSGSSYFEVPTLQFYNDQEMTASIWFRLSGELGLSQTLISKELTFKIRINPGGELQVFAGDGVAWTVSPTFADAYTYTEWTNITVTVNSTSTVIYKDGQQLGTTTGAVLGSTGNFPFNIGSYSNGSDIMLGKVGEVQYYTGVRTAQQIADDYIATVSRYVPPAPITAYVNGWNDVSNWLAPDVAGNPNLTRVVAGWTVTGPLDFTATVIGSPFSNGTNWVIPVDASLAGFTSSNQGNYTFTPPA